MRSDHEHSSAAKLLSPGQVMSPFNHQALCASRSALWLLALMWCVTASSAPGVTSEYRIKAAFILNFVKFVTWPADRLTKANEPIVIGVLSQNVVALELAKLTENRAIHDHPLVVKHIQSAADLAEAHVLYITADELSRYEVVRSARNDLPTLLVSDAESCERVGATICFVIQDDRLKFSIDTQAASRSRLKVSSYLQQLAISRPN